MESIIVFVILELGLFVLALLVSFLLGRIGIKSPWPMLAGWLAQTTWALFLTFNLTGAARAGHQPPAFLYWLLPIFLLLGWLPASYLGAWGECQRKKRDHK
jgi:hypothetical protein